MTQRFKLESEYIELSKLLKVTGLCDSGGMAKVAIVEGQVKGDGSVELRKGRKIRKGAIFPRRCADLQLGHTRGRCEQ